MLAQADLMTLAGILIFFGAALIGYESLVRIPRRPLAWRIDYLARLRTRLAQADHGETGGGMDDEDEFQTAPRRSINPTGTLISALRALSGLLGSFVMLSQAEQDKLKLNLRHAGIGNSDALPLMITAKTAALLLAGLTAFGLQLVIPENAVDPLMYWVFAIPSVIIAGSIPEKILGALAKRRRDAIVNSLPDALDLMIICTNAGYGLDVTIARVARDLRGYAEEMAEEMSITAAELRVLPNRREALENLANRTDVPGLRAVVGALNQAQRYGTPIAHALRTTAAELRSTNMLALEEWAAKIPAKMTFPIVLLILPSVFLIIAGPTFVQILRSF